MSVAPAPRRTDAVFRRAAERGALALDRLLHDIHDRAAYIDLRRASLTSMYAWRRAISTAAEAAFGPEIIYDEPAGSLALLDRALAVGDDQAARAAADQLRGAFAMAKSEIERRGLSASRTAQATSDAAYALGQALSESSGFVPDGHDAAFADALGLLDAVSEGAAAIDCDLHEPLAKLERLRTGPSFKELSNRIELVRATGPLGRRIRECAANHGEAVRPPYIALGGEDTVSAITLPRPNVAPEPAKVALGAKLFSDPRLSRGAVRSCATCHDARFAFTDHRVTPPSIDPAHALVRNTPTLLFVPLEARLAWDGRIRTADQQALTVIHTSAEMGLDDEALLAVIRGDPAYLSGFTAAFGHAPTAADIGHAIAAFESQAFIPNNAPVDRFARGELAELGALETRGFDVFVGEGRCGRCHVPPVFAGSRPPDFTAAVFGELGVPTVPDGGVVDPDVGRIVATHIAKDRFAFRTPTVRNIAATAPYFHNGRFPTLESVLEFYDRGGGKALGIEVPLQDPDVRELHLSADDKRAVLAFMTHSLSSELK